jgi:hypothetical protein
VQKKRQCYAVSAERISRVRYTFAVAAVQSNLTRQKEKDASAKERLFAPGHRWDAPFFIMFGRQWKADFDTQESGIFVAGLSLVCR